MKVRNKDKKIVYPKGDDLGKYLRQGYAVCNRCGALMDRKVDPQVGGYYHVCPACGWEIDDVDYEYEDPMTLVTDEDGNECLVYKRDIPPAGCRACGGPYPDCLPSCKMYDD